MLEKCIRKQSKKKWSWCPAAVYFCSVWLVINSIGNLLRGENDSWSQWTELWFERPKFWRQMVMIWLHQSEQPNPTDFNGPGKNLIQLQLQFPHWNLAVTSGELSPCTKSCNSSWQGAFKALLGFCFPFYQATQCHAVPSCQSIQSTGHHLELMPIPEALFSSSRRKPLLEKLNSPLFYEMRQNHSDRI